jgi:hypothetical protein
MAIILKKQKQQQGKMWKFCDRVTAPHNHVML